ncbi:MAG: hypothetical protein ABI960_09140, partial [Candidatus Eisenbacteria bacterium]
MTPLSDRPLRVLHGTYEIAGQGMVLAAGLTAAGADAKSLAYRVDWDGRRPAIVVELDALPLPARGAVMLGTFARHAPAYDVFHFHFGTSFLPRLLDVPLLKAMGKTVVFHFHGCEVRNKAWMRSHHALAACTECDPFCRPDRQRRLLAEAARHADRVYYSTKDLAESVPGGVELPLAIEADRWEAAGRATVLSDPERRDGVNGPVVIAHTQTTTPLIKGTPHVEAAVDLLRAEFPRLEYRRIEKLPWAQMPAAIAQCDVLVDQLFMGWYGLLAIEGMCVGKPVVCYLRPEFAAEVPDCPLVSATPSSVA